jgi:geranylgeranylglycerol-phosphate geranylgeranyltransferase
MSKAKALWELTRLEHGLMLALGILVGALLSIQELPPWDVYLLTLLTAVLLEASAFALNDYFDYDIDVRNKRTDRPLVRGELQKSTALVVFGALFPLGIVSSFFVNWTCFAIALVTALFAIIYDAAGKRLKLVGNFYIAYIMAVPFVFGAASVTETDALTFGLPQAVLAVALIAFLAGAGREIMKDAQDVAGDREAGTRSFATLAGTRPACALAAVFYLVAVALSLVPFLSTCFGPYHMNYYYLAPILATDAVLVYVSADIVARPEPPLALHRKLTLAALFLGLVGFLAGAFLG